MILKYKTPCSRATNRPDSALLCLSQIKKAHHLCTWQSGLFYAQEIIEPLSYHYLFEFPLVTFRDREALLEIFQPVQPWSFDAEASLLRLVSGAYRIRRLTFFAVHTSLVETFPH